MPIEYRIDPETGWLIANAAGTIGDADIADFVDQLLADPAEPTNLDTLYDYRELTGLGELSVDSVRKLANLEICDPEVKARKRSAFVAPVDVAYGMGRMFETLTSETMPSFRVFRTIEEALAFLSEGRPSAADD